MANVTPENWGSLKRNAQDAILEAADRRWYQATPLSNEVRVARTDHVKFGGMVWLAYKMATNAVRQGGPKADQAPTRNQLILARQLVGMGRVQRVRLFMDVFKDSLIRTRKDGSVVSGSPLSNHLFPRDRAPGASEQSDYINVLVNGRLGRAAVVVSLWRPIDEPERLKEPASEGDHETHADGGDTAEHGRRDLVYSEAT